VAETLDLTAELLYARLKRAVDLLWRETVRRRRAFLDERERRRSARRMKNLQKIVRKALEDYHHICSRGDRPPGPAPAAVQNGDRPPGPAPAAVQNGDRPPGPAPAAVQKRDDPPRTL
jgi:hypothetical protein